jgi:CDP-2,3-bis-(O-geranylgeranyl)-sn-glycerol synthase
VGDVIAAFWLFLPAGIANSVPVILTKLLGAGRAVDERLFGAHKTWQGLIGGTVAGVVCFALQKTLRSVDAPWLFGIFISAGALFGDLVKSLIKRRLRIVPGRSWFPFDQLDFIVTVAPPGRDQRDRLFRPACRGQRHGLRDSV